MFGFLLTCARLLMTTLNTVVCSIPVNLSYFIVSCVCVLSGFDASCSESTGWSTAEHCHVGDWCLLQQLKLKISCYTVFHALQLYTVYSLNYFIYIYLYAFVCVCWDCVITVSLLDIACSSLYCLYYWGSGGTAAAAPPPLRPSDPALCGSCPLVTLY